MFSVIEWLFNLFECCFLFSETTQKKLCKNSKITSLQIRNNYPLPTTCTCTTISCVLTLYKYLLKLVYTKVGYRCGPTLLMITSTTRAWRYIRFGCQKLIINLTFYGCRHTLDLHSNHCYSTDSGYQCMVTHTRTAGLSWPSTLHDHCTQLL